jgi:hypothetical protein
MPCAALLIAALIVTALPPATPDRHPAFARQSGACPDFETGIALDAPVILITTWTQDIHASPVSESAILGELLPNQPVTVIAGPVCEETTSPVWWRIDYEGLIGWIQGGFHWDERIDLWLAPASDSEGFRRRVPPDAVEGIGFSMGGGLYANAPENTVDCFVELLEEGLFGGVPVEGDIAAFYYSCAAKGMVKIANGQTVALATRDLSTRWWDKRFAPVICFDRSVPAQTSALSPDGDELAPAEVSSIFECDPATKTAIQLPEQAYHQPGLWHLRVNDFEIGVDIPVAQTPIFGDYTNEEDERIMWLAGFEPFERVIIFVGFPFGGAGPAERRQLFEVQMDDTGYFVGAVDVEGRIYAAVGETGNLHWKGACEGSEDCATDLYNALWGDHTDQDADQADPGK